MYHKIEKCRVCGNQNLTEVLDLGNQYLTGIFPKSIDIQMHKSPLKLVKCDNSECSHIQLEHTFNPSVMYGEDYGYRSGLNPSMVNHLQSKCERILGFLNFQEKDIVIDIAGNDGTFLGFFPTNLRLVSIDPTSQKFSQYFKSNVEYISSFFSEKTFKSHFPNQKAKLVTSFAMFYDLEDPCKFAKEINHILDENEGVWVLEQSYMPHMLKVNSFDTICQEHLSYYGMRQIKYIMDTAGFKIIDFEFNDVNGGSFSVTVANQKSKYDECIEKINEIIQQELNNELNTFKPWNDFKIRIDQCKNEFLNSLQKLKQSGLKIAALGASTKGNVLLQSWNIQDYIDVIGDVNPEKNGSYTPGTWIPIKDEDSVLAEYDVFVILPWHFKDFFIRNQKFKGKKLLFPLPTLELITV